VNFRRYTLPIVGTVLALLGAPVYTRAEQESQSLGLAQMVQRYCVGPDGDHRATWTYVEQDGFSLILASDVSGLDRLPGVVNSSIRGFSKRQGDREIRVLTGASWWQIGGQGRTFSRWCWVSSNRADLDRTTAEMSELIGYRGFRSERVRIYAWIPRPGDIRESVSRRRYFREGNVIARTQGMRQVLLRRYEDGVFIAYGSPRDEETYQGFDWSGPEPMPAPQR
jgi:hypothetical protein